MDQSVAHDDWSRGRQNARKSYSSRHNYKPSTPPANKRRGKNYKRKRNIANLIKVPCAPPAPPDSWISANTGCPGYVSAPPAPPAPSAPSAPPAFGMIYEPYERILEYLTRPLTYRDIYKPRPPNTYTVEFMKQLTEEMLNDPQLGSRGRMAPVINSDGTINISPTLDDPPDPRFWKFSDFYVYRPPRY